MTVRDLCIKIFRTKDESLLWELEQAAKIRNFEKGEVLIAQGDIQYMLYFLVEGVIRGCLLDENGNERTISMVHRLGAPVLSVRSLKEMGQPVDAAWEVIEDARLLILSIAKLKELLVNYPEMALVYSRFLEEAMDEHWRLQKGLHYGSAARRYAWFLQAYPGLIDRIPHTYVAAFLNMTPVSLSRVRRQADVVRL